MSQPPDETMPAIAAAVALGHEGRRDDARLALVALWDSLAADGGAGDPLVRCVLAHSLADLQGDPVDELRWDEQALAAADEVTDEQVAAAGVTSPVAALYPSLHLNLADVHHRLGHPEAARQHLALAVAAAPALPDDGYGTMIKDGIDALARRLDTDLDRT